MNGYEEWRTDVNWSYQHVFIARLIYCREAGSMAARLSYCMRRTRSTLRFVVRFALLQVQQGKELS